MMNNKEKIIYICKELYLTKKEENCLISVFENIKNNGKLNAVNFMQINSIFPFGFKAMSKTLNFDIKYILKEIKNGNVKNKNMSKFLDNLILLTDEYIKSIRFDL